MGSSTLASAVVSVIQVCVKMSILKGSVPPNNFTMLNVSPSEVLLLLISPSNKPYALYDVIAELALWTLLRALMSTLKVTLS